MKNSRTTAVGTASGVVLAVVMLVAFALDMLIIQGTSGPPILSADNIGADLLRARGSTIWLLEGWVYTLMVLPGIAFTLRLYQALREVDAGLAGLGLAASALFWIFHTLHNVAMLAVLQVLVPRYASGTPQGTSIEIVATGLLGVANLLFSFGASIGALFLVGSLIAFGLAILRSGVPVSRWTGYLAMAGGLAVLLSYLQFLVGSFMFVGIIGWLLTIAWVAGATAMLLRQESGGRLVPEMRAK